MPKALPANPNLDWLRKSAKQRLAELRAEYPTPGFTTLNLRSPATMASRAGGR